MAKNSESYGLTSAEVVRLQIRYRQGDIDALETVIRKNNRLVQKVARKFVKETGFLSYEDLFSEGIIGIIDAFTRFDSSKGAKFSTYAMIHIQKRVFAAFRDFNGMVRVPRYKYDRLKKKRELEMELLKSSSLEANQLREDREKEEERIQNVMFPLSLDYCLVGDDSDLSEHLARQEPDALAISFSRERRVILSELLCCLDERELFVIKKRFGWDNNGIQMGLNDIGQLLDISKARVGQIMKTALKKLRRKVERLKFHDLFVGPA